MNNLTDSANFDELQFLGGRGAPGGGGVPNGSLRSGRQNPSLAFAKTVTNLGETGRSLRLRMEEHRKEA